MVVVKLEAGLGNQLFQYATARRLALVNGLPLKLDITWYERSALREYKLHHFNISAEIATPGEIAGFHKSYSRRWADSLARLAYEYLPNNKGPLLKERGCDFDPRVLEVSGGARLEGFWQCEKYFADIGDVIRRELTVKSEPDEVNKEVARQIARVDSVCLHVRRGDYLADPRYRLCSPDYYWAAVREITRSVSEPHFFIFSDDPQWTRDNLKLEHPATFVTHNGAAGDYEDLRLMSACKHFIIANSTFSWWGAWLGAHAGKVVIAPERWVNDPRIDNKDRLPESWVVV